MVVALKAQGSQMNDTRNGINAVLAKYEKRINPAVGRNGEESKRWMVWSSSSTIELQL